MSSIDEQEDEIHDDLAPTPFNAMFEHMSQTFDSIATFANLDEEAVTSCVLGGMTATFPLFVDKFGSGGDEERAMSWGQYKKSRTKNELVNESHRGADFALVVRLTPKRVRLLVIQAKHGQCKPAVDKPNGSEIWRLNVHRRPPRPPKGDWREAQMVRLARTGLLFERATNLSASPKEDAKVAIAAEIKRVDELHAQTLSLNKLHWVHYLGYFDQWAVCVPLSMLGAYYARECLDGGSDNFVDITDSLKPRLFLDVLKAGVANTCESGWLELETSLAELLLPELVNLMPVMVGDSSGGAELCIENAECLTTKIIASASTASQRADLKKFLPKIRKPKPGA